MNINVLFKELFVKGIDRGRDIICVMIMACMLFTVTYPQSLAAEDSNTDSGYANADEVLAGGRYASAPECGLTPTDMLLVLGSFIMAYNAMKYAIKLWIKSKKQKNPVSKKQMRARAAYIWSAAIVSAITISALMVDVICLYSFARDPVYRDPNDPTLMKKKSGAGTTRNYYEALVAPYSDVLELCTRGMIPFTAYVTDPTCHGVGRSAALNNAYDDHKSLLCPQEWRNAGYKRDTDDAGAILSGDAVPDIGSPKYNPTLIEMKQTSGPVDCHVAKLGDTFHSQGYLFRTKARAGKICAVVEGLSLVGDLSISPGSSPRVVGCHYMTPQPPVPACPGSIPIRKDGTVNTDGTIQPGTGTGEIVGYDDSPCYQCYISYWCHAHTMQITQAIIPIIAPLIHCIQQTMNLVINGCANESGATVGLINIVQKQLEKVNLVVIALAVAFFFLSLLLGFGDTKKSDVMMFVFKVGLTFFLSMAANSHGESGMHFLTKLSYGISNGLGAIVLRAGFHNGLCNYDTTDYIVTYVDQHGNNVREDHSYIMIYDMMDCMANYFLGLQLIEAIDLIGQGALINTALHLLLLPLTLIFSFFDILGAILALLFDILLLLILVWAAIFIIVSIFGIALISVLIASATSLILFHYTEGYYFTLIKEFLSYFLLPVFLMLAMGIIFATFLFILYGQTQFVPVMIKVAGKNVKYFAPDDGHCYDVPLDFADPDSETEEQCGCDMSKPGCQLGSLNFFTGHLVFGINVTKVTDRISAGSLAIMAIVAFIFARFFIMLPSLVIELSGGARSLLIIVRLAPTPTKILGGVVSGVKKLVSGKKDDKKKDDKKRPDKGGEGKGDDKNDDKGGGGKHDDGDKHSGMRDKIS